MKRSLILATLLAVVLVFALCASVALAKKQNPLAATSNVSFPQINTDLIQIFYQQAWVDFDADGVVDASEWIIDYDLDDDGVAEMTLPTPLAVEEVIRVQYNGTYPGNDGEFFEYYTLDENGCPVDVNGDGVIDDGDLTAVDMVTWLRSMAPWYPQPVTTTTTDPNLIWNAGYVTSANSWQADWYWTGDVDGDPATADPVADGFVVNVDFIDWGNPLENIDPIVGQRFPVEIALYEKVASRVVGDEWGETMTAYKMACLEYPGTKTELFGTSASPDPDPGSFTYESCFASVITNKFFAEVWNPDGTITKIPISPGIGPSGKMNFASSGGGWIPTMPGWHRIWLHVNDPQISFTGAIVNNDEHYIMSTGCKVQDISANKLELTGIVGDSTYIDVYVERPSGKKK